MSVRAGAAWRVIDTGLRRPAENFAINQALLSCHQAGKSPHTLRFLRFTPSALVGFHQNVEQELRIDYCQAQDIDIQRRLTGGGALYFDETQLGWELYLDKRTLGTADMGAIASRICTAAASGISSLGVDAHFRPRNDIEVDGRKISGTGGAFDGDSILYQGTLLIEFDVEKMLKVLRIPAEKLSDKAISSARERVVNLGELLGSAPSMSRVQQAMTEAFAQEFGVRFESASEMNVCEQGAYADALAEIDSPEWVFQHNRPIDEAPMLESVYRSEGGLMRACVAVDRSRNHLKQVWITGDFFVSPNRLVLDLEAALKDTPITALEDNVNGFFAGTQTQMLRLTPGDFIKLIRLAVDETPLQSVAAPGEH
ncbi:lipoate--protein ligase family protein [Acidihalobacter prosperus]|uniref:Lipoate--protein ligase n=1 Tax=Acidihalobacter prosperus TaxID=160660 RepID=A0A1A6C6I7_9GAMM|nr:lipoate--protein ligase [Acidihalobacter prosperus]